MTETTILLLSLLSVSLLAIEQAARLSTRPEWLRVPALWRAVAAIVVGAGAGIVAGVQTGATWKASALAVAIVTVPTLVKVFAHVDTLPPAAAVLLLIAGLTLPTSGCAGSLQAARDEGRAARMGQPVGAVGSAPSARCRGLDRDRIALSGWAKGALGMAVASASVLLIPAVYRSTPGRIGAVAAGGVFTATAGGLQVAADGTADAWLRECAP